MSLRIAITGPTGAGKSRLCRLLAARGATVIEADTVGHEVLDEPAVRARVVAAFGREIVGQDGLVDRAALGRIVFADSRQRERLEVLVHPTLAAVCTSRMSAAQAAGSPLVILEAAVYFLLPGPPPVDMTVTVTASASVRLARLEARLEAEGLDPARARARLVAQAHLEPFWRRADRSIVNAGTEAELAAVAAELWRELVAPDSPGGTLR